MDNVVYRMFDEHGDLLYIGKSGNYFQRMETHMKDKPWWGQVANITVTHYPCRCTCEDGEREAIQLEMPKYNVQHNQARIAKDFKVVVNGDPDLPIGADDF